MGGARLRVEPSVGGARLRVEPLGNEPERLAVEVREEGDGEEGGGGGLSPPPLMKRGVCLAPVKSGQEEEVEEEVELARLMLLVASPEYRREEGEGEVGTNRLAAGEGGVGGRARPSREGEGTLPVTTTTTWCLEGGLRELPCRSAPTPVFSFCCI